MKKKTGTRKAVPLSCTKNQHINASRNLRSQSARKWARGVVFALTLNSERRVASVARHDSLSHAHSNIAQTTKKALPRTQFTHHFPYEHDASLKSHHHLSTQKALFYPPSVLSPTMPPSPPSTHVTLISSDGFEFIVKREAACVAGTIRKMLDPQSELILYLCLICI